MKHAALAALAALALALAAGDARADGPVSAPDTIDGDARARDVRSEVPIVAYAYSASGSSAGTVGAQAYGLGVTGSSGNRAILGGGATVWGSPVDRLTLVGDGARDVFGNFAPSAAMIVRLLGTPGQGFSLGALGKFKVDGFGIGPNDEIESEIEGGLLLSYVRRGWHFDLNAITGFGTGEDGEVDAEGRLRLGKDVGIFRLGVDGQGRYRMNGATKLLGGRSGDFAVGPQLMLGSDHLFAALTSGPATMGVATGIGWTAIVNVGGASF